jgi:hypothetical protein
MPETDLFASVKAWLEDRDFTVYSEVAYGYGSKRADVVGVRGPLMAVVELKMSLSLALIGQCAEWTRSAHYVYAAVPDPRLRNFGFGQTVLAQNGIGLLGIHPYGHVRCIVSPKLHRSLHPRLHHALRSALCDQQQTGVPGGRAGGGYVTPYSRTMDRVRLYLIRERYLSQWDNSGREGWRTVREIVAAVETHYSNPKSGVGGALLKFEGDWCERRMVDGKWEFRVREGTKL